MFNGRVYAALENCTRQLGCLSPVSCFDLSSIAQKGGMRKSSSTSKRWLSACFVASILATKALHSATQGVSSHWNLYRLEQWKILHVVFWSKHLFTYNYIKKYICFNLGFITHNQYYSICPSELRNAMWRSLLFACDLSASCWIYKLWQAACSKGERKRLLY